jgi:hypothetical protein
VGDRTYALLTSSIVGFASPGPVTATVVAIDTGAASSGAVPVQVPMIPQMSGSRELLGYVRPYLWFGEYGDLGGLSKIVRVRALGQ